MLNKHPPQEQQMGIVETSIPRPGNHAQRWEQDREKLWASDEQQIGQAKPQPGFTFQNQRPVANKPQKTPNYVPRVLVKNWELQVQRKADCIRLSRTEVPEHLEGI